MIQYSKLLRLWFELGALLLKDIITKSHESRHFISNFETSRIIFLEKKQPPRPAPSPLSQKQRRKKKEKEKLLRKYNYHSRFLREVLSQENPPEKFGINQIKIFFKKNLCKQGLF